MKILGLVLCLCLITTFVFAETYTGRAENVQATERGLSFTVVVVDGSGKEVLRRDQWVSTGVMEAQGAVNAVLNVVDRMTQDMWAHIEGAEEAVKSKTTIEAYRSTCSVFTDPTTRPNPQDTR